MQGRDCSRVDGGREGLDRGAPPPGHEA